MTLGLALAGAVRFQFVLGDDAVYSPPATTGASVRLPNSLMIAQVPLSDFDAFGLTDNGRVPVGSRIVMVDRPGDAEGVVDLTNGFVAAGRPDLSFDGQRVLFVGRRRDDARQDVWELKLSSRAVRRVLQCQQDCERAVYLSTLFTINARRPEPRIAIVSREDPSSPTEIYTCRTDGDDLRRITFAPYGARDPFLLSDGRLLFVMARSSVLPNEDRRMALQRRHTAWFTVNVDGTDLLPFAAVHEPPAQRVMACETTDDRVVYLEAPVTGKGDGNALISVSRTRSLRTRQVVLAGGETDYHSPVALPGARLMVSIRRDGDPSKRTFGVSVLDPARPTRLQPVYDDPDWHDVYARAIAPRVEPVGRSSVVQHRDGFGELYCLDAYRTGLEIGHGSGANHISHVRIERFDNDDALPLGEVPVESDGSFFVELPAGVPIRLATRTDQGDVLQAMSSWFWVMPGERRGCIGCHEDRELAPPNVHAYALRKLPLRIGGAIEAEKETGQPGDFGGRSK